MKLETERLRLRPFVEEDREAFARMNADPRVAEFLGEPLSREKSDAFAEQIQDSHRRLGYGLAAVEIRDTRTFVGFVGLHPVPAPAPFRSLLPLPIEIGWRLDAAHWGKGYATEAATAVLAYAFDVLELVEVVSFTAASNVRSRRVMEKIGLRHDPSGDFLHPGMPADHPLRPHVLLYRGLIPLLAAALQR